MMSCLLRTGKRENEMPPTIPTVYAMRKIEIFYRIGYLSKASSILPSLQALAIFTTKYTSKYCRKRAIQYSLVALRSFPS